MLIAIDTSTDFASIAIVRDGVLLAETTWQCRQNHSVELLPRLAYLLEKAKVDIQSASGVVVARGPGSYNGLRVGVSTAKGLAFSLHVPLTGISTLEAEAYQHAEAGLPVCAVARAGREEIAAAIFQMRGKDWSRPLEEHITTVNNLCSKITGTTIFCGEVLPVFAGTIKGCLGDRAVIPSPASLIRRAYFLAELGLKRMNAGDYDEPASLQPLYLRRPHINEPKRKYWSLTEQ